MPTIMDIYYSSSPSLSSDEYVNEYGDSSCIGECNGDTVAKSHNQTRIQTWIYPIQGSINEIHSGNVTCILW